MISNSIWETLDDSGNLVTDQDSIKERDISYFSGLYKDPKNANIIDQLEVLKLYPTMFNEEECSQLGRPIGLSEVEHTLKAFAKDKIPGPNGWALEFYLHFFKMLGSELVEAIGENKVTGLIPESLNTTYLTLIPKVDRPTNFVDYRLIALCNLFTNLSLRLLRA